MSILVIGQSGQIARALAERATPPHGVVTLGRPELDITDPGSIRRSIAAQKPQLVINASAYTAVDKAETEPDAAFAVNAEGPGALAEACAAAGIPLIHYSTDYVYDGSKAGPYVEDDPTSPLGVYGRSKLAGEDAVRAAGGDHVILRTAWVYSPFAGNFVRTMLRLASSRDELGVVADQWGCPTSALDIADATLVIADRWFAGNGQPGMFHMAGTGETNWHGFAEEIFRLSKQVGGPSATARPIPATEFPTPAKRPANSRLDCARLEQVYSITLPEWQDSLRETVRRLLEEEESV
ncbi:dTDP-4-dehydrorhamnose reductase [Henriciella mobilis]|uniref:dTDP-4-dehydrorhamnose reductase n=1 Tax=Henriciella mobilis TaxID=2305467 RepID=UPI000E65FAD2|nr:dTDP-4-dehydrorhamnose reductase [Henriciella mobilis]RIJ17360.1 dTDP-4-dehydrorhamnose reductase [Henriciella mobilis]RIJ25651.1 dTDP-4-dehydrorhamnose reductase [Henriciella mobilis]